VSPRRHYRIVGTARLAAMAAGVAMAAVLPAGQALAASAAPSANSPGTTTANVVVGGAILLSDLTPSFTLSGVPGDTPENDGAVTMRVFTNNASGYNVTVQAASANLVGTSPNTDTIPVGDISVEETGSGAYQALSSTAADVVYTQDTRSAAAPGDLLSNDYEFNTPIPDVITDTYSVTLDYIATTNP
jgi:large repetitive protein